MSDAGLFLSITKEQRAIIARSVRGDSPAKIACSLRMSEPRVRAEIESFMRSNNLTTAEQVGATAVRAGIC